MLLAHDTVLATERAADFVPDPLYYVTHFRRFLDDVQTCYGALLSADEQDYCRTIAALPENALALYVRLTNRRGAAFRVNRLEYLSGDDLVQAIDDLRAARLLQYADCNTLPCADLLRLFTLAELRALFAIPVRTWRRDEICGWLLDHPGTHSALLAQGAVVMLAPSCLDYLKFLYFGALHGHLSAFVVRELGHIDLETVDGAVMTPRFATMRAARDCFAMHRLYDDFRVLRENLEPHALHDWFTAHNIDRSMIDAAAHERYDRLVSRLGRILERAGLSDPALTVYACSPCFAAAERGLRILLKRKDHDAVRQWIAAARTEAFTAGERHVWRELLDKTGTTRTPARGLRLLRAATETFIAWHDGEAVEDAALRHWAAQGWSGVHSENWLWHALFGLLLWDIVYAPDAAGFHNPLQIAPDGLYRRGYFQPSMPRIKTRLDMLARPDDCATFIGAVFATKKGKTNPFLSWHDDTLDIVNHLLRRAPHAGLRHVLLRLARDLGASGSGLPDLFIWTDSAYRFLEVKSPNDRIQPQQYQWLRAFRRAGLDCGVMRVRRA